MAHLFKPNPPPIPGTADPQLVTGPRRRVLMRILFGISLFILFAGIFLLGCALYILTHPGPTPDVPMLMVTLTAGAILFCFGFLYVIVTAASLY